MERQKGSYVLAAVALCIAVVALAVGFAAFSDTATVTTNATVTPDNDLKVELSSNSTGTVLTTSVTATSTGVTGTTNPTGSGTLTTWSNGTSTINLTGNFTNIGQELTYVFYARNTGNLKAFLNDVSYSGQIACSAAETNPGNAAMIANACETMTLSMEVRDNNTTPSAATLNVVYSDTTKKASIDTAHSIAAITGFDTITVKVKYNGNSNADENFGKVDGNFNVQFGTITLTYGSTDSRS